jgi:acyl-CoA carboxylase subunit beta
VTILANQLDTGSAAFRNNRDALEIQLAEINELLVETGEGGGPRAIARHRQRGKLTVRERIALLLDAGAPFLEFSPLAGWGSEFAVGASLVTGIGNVNGVECVIAANDPTVRGGASNPYSVKKIGRALDASRRNRLPFVYLVESGGADLPTQAEIFLPGGRLFRDLTQFSALGIPTIALVFGNSTAGGAYVPGMSDYTVMVDGAAKVFLGGPPLVKMATGEDADDEELGGAQMHARQSGLADFLAIDEVDCCRIGRMIVQRLNWRKLGPPPRTEQPAPPLYDAEELIGIAPADLRTAFDPRDVLARILDGSDFDEFKPLYGDSLVTGWGEIWGYPVGILANHRGVLFNEEAEKGSQFIQLANRADTPLLYLHNTTGYMVGKRYEQRGMVKDGSKMINAVANSAVPAITINLGGSYGAGNYGMSGLAFDPRFLFAWPNSKSAVMGPAQLAGVMSIVARQSAQSRGEVYDEAADSTMRERVQAQIEAESKALFITGKVYDDGVIDPRDTRIVVGLCLSAVHSAQVAGAERFGVFRM